MKMRWCMHERPAIGLIVGLGGLVTVVNLAWAQPWSAGGAPPGPYQSWQAIAASADGTRLVAAVGRTSTGYYRNLYGSFPLTLTLITSVDGGATWLPSSAPTNLWRAVASSADGVKLVAVATADQGFADGDGLIYISTDSGRNWVQTTAPPSLWQAVASSGDGTKLVAANERIYTSGDGGETWLQASAPIGDWTSVASSADGTRLAAVAQWSRQNGLFYPGGIYISQDSGATWIRSNAPSNAWASVASSADGTKFAAAAGSYWDGTNWVNMGGIYTSADSGATWIQTSAPAIGWVTIASSADGSRLVASAGQQIFASTDAGATWKPTAAPAPVGQWTMLVSSADGYSVAAANEADWLCTLPYFGPWRSVELPGNSLIGIASSADGAKLLAAGANDPIWEIGTLYSSVDSGATWAALNAPTNSAWSSVASSGDGSRLVAAAEGYNIYDGAGEFQSYPYGLIFISTNSGSTWMQSSAPGEQWTSVASSADGAVLTAAAWSDTSGQSGRGWVFGSTNMGASWFRTTAPQAGWTGVATSAAGTQVVAAMQQDALGNPGQIYLSTNSGFSWGPTTAPSNRWTAVASSGDGSKLAACGIGVIYVSTNSGASWTASSAPINAWSSISCSAEGDKLVAVANTSPSLPLVYLSTDFGGTWAPANAPAADWRTVACAANGSNIVVVGSSSVATLRVPAPSPPLPPSPQVTLNRSGADVELSCLVPSAHFALERSHSLTPANWADVTNQPSLNFTNLHYEWRLPLSLGNGFYRLKQK